MCDVSAVRVYVRIYAARCPMMLSLTMVRVSVWRLPYARHSLVRWSWRACSRFFYLLFCFRVLRLAFVVFQTCSSETARERVSVGTMDARAVARLMLSATANVCVCCCFVDRMEEGTERVLYVAWARAHITS